MSYTREQWVTDFLHAIGNTNPSNDIINWTLGWTMLETSAGSGATYNLLNTTQQMPGSWSFNTVGVQNYTSYAQGIEANKIVLENGLYPVLLKALQTNTTSVLGQNTSGIVDPGIVANLNTWCGECNYAQKILQVIGMGSVDTFEGDRMTNSVPIGWIDDGTTLTAANGVPIVLGFREFVLSKLWEPRNVPLAKEYHADPLEESNTSLGAGQKQEFLLGDTLEWTSERGVFQAYAGREAQFIKADRARLAAELAAAEMQLKSTQVIPAIIEADIEKLAADAESIELQVYGKDIDAVTAVTQPTLM